jgi:hypothetical protein
MILDLRVEAQDAFLNSCRKRKSCVMGPCRIAMLCSFCSWCRMNRVEMLQDRDNILAQGTIVSRDAGDQEKRRLSQKIDRSFQSY